MKTSNEFKMNKVVNYVNNNIDKVKGEFKLKLNEWFTDKDYIINELGIETFDEWKDFCSISIGEGVLTNTGFAFMSDEDYRMTLLDKVKEGQYFSDDQIENALLAIGEMSKENKIENLEKNLNLLSINDLVNICKKNKIKNFKILKNKFFFFK